MTATILAAVDFSHASDAAARLAAVVAVARGARLVLCHVSPPPLLAAVVVEPFIVPPAWVEAIRRRHDREVDAKLAYLEERLRDEVPGLVVERHLHLGVPATGIVAAAIERGAVLIVMASHAGRAARFLVGSVTERVAAIAPCPVLVPTPAATPDGAVELRPYRAPSAFGPTST